MYHDTHRLSGLAGREIARRILPDLRQHMAK